MTASDDDMLATLEKRLGRLHARQRLGIEKDHEAQIFGQGLTFFHPENATLSHALIRGVLMLTGLYWRGLSNSAKVELRHHRIVAPDLPAAFEGFTILQLSDLHVELSEAAKLDGCSEWGIFTRIVAPLAKPAIAVVALFAFMAAWNDFLGPLIYLHSQEQFTLSLGLQFYRSQQGSEWHLLMAASTVVVAPVVALFFFTQPVLYFVIVFGVQIVSYVITFITGYTLTNKGWRERALWRSFARYIDDHGEIKRAVGPAGIAMWGPYLAYGAVLGEATAASRPLMP